MKFKNWWKSKSYWLKGGIVGLILTLVLYALLMALIAEFGCTGGSFAPLKTCTRFEIVTYYFNSLITLPFNSLIFFGSFVVTFVAAFWVGSLIGWIVGKIKSKK